jgi:hypothetical protein
MEKTVSQFFSFSNFGERRLIVDEDSRILRVAVMSYEDDGEDAESDDPEPMNPARTRTRSPIRRRARPLVD